MTVWMQDKISGLQQVAAAVVASVLLIMGAILLLLLFTPLYPYYLNPSFKPLSAAAGVLLLVCGVLFAFRPPAGVTIQTAVLYILTIAAVTNSLTGTMVLYGSRTMGGTPKTAVASTDAEGAEDSESSLKSPRSQSEVSPADTHIPISIPELYLLMGANPPKVVFEPLKIRGRIVRIATSDGKGPHHLIARPAMTCCVADAIQVFLPVRLPAERSNIDLSDGTWISVEGSLLREEVEIPDEEVKGKLQDTVIAFSAIERAYVFEAHTVEIAEAPARPYVTLFNEQPPFSY